MKKCKECGKELVNTSGRVFVCFDCHITFDLIDGELINLHKQQENISLVSTTIDGILYKN